MSRVARAKVFWHGVGEYWERARKCLVRGFAGLAGLATARAVQDLQAVRLVVGHAVL